MRAHTGHNNRSERIHAKRSYKDPQEISFQVFFLILVVLKILLLCKLSLTMHKS